MRSKLKGREKFKTDRRHIPEIKSNETYEEQPEILSFGDRIEEYRRGTLETSVCLSLVILLHF